MERLGETLHMFEPLFAEVGAGVAPLFCVTPIVDGVPTIHMSVPLGPLDMSKLPEGVGEPGKMDDYLFKYVDEKAGTFDMPALIHDDYFKAIRLLYNNRMRSMKDAGLSCGVRRETQRSSAGMAQGSSAA